MRAGVVHDLKTWPAPFQASWVGDKTFEVRSSDRDFQERDELILSEFDPEAQEFTGREITGVIRYIVRPDEPPSPLIGKVVVFGFEITGRSEG